MRSPRPIKNSLLALLLIFVARQAGAQFLSADDYFNGGAQLYISNNIPAALDKTESGLKVFPNDEKLQKLEKLLKQQQQSQSQQNQQQQQNQQSQSQQQQSKNNQQNPQQQNSSGQQQNQQQQDKQNQSNPDQQNGSQQNQQQKNSGDKSQGANAGEQQGKMSAAQADKLLDDQKGDEKVLQFGQQGKPKDSNKPVKDW